jgi:deoxycytidylate deaminase
MPWQFGQFTPRDMRYFDAAHALARASNHHKAKIGSVIVLGTEIISAAHNVEKSHPMQAKYNVHRHLKGANRHTHHLHAEINSLVKLKSSTESFGARIYVSRVKNGGVGMCKPCPACVMALRDFGIRDIFYTTDTGLAYERLLELQ